MDLSKKQRVHEFNGRVKIPGGITTFVARDIIDSLQNFNGDFVIVKGEKTFDMRSILGLVSMVIQEGEQIKVLADISDKTYLPFKQFLETIIDVHNIHNKEHDNGPI